jgi:hypothetical protein
VFRSDWAAARVAHRAPITPFVVHCEAEGRGSARLKPQRKRMGSVVGQQRAERAEIEVEVFGVEPEMVPEFAHLLV